MSALGVTDPWDATAVLFKLPIVSFAGDCRKVHNQLRIQGVGGIGGICTPFEMKKKNQIYKAQSKLLFATNNSFLCIILFQ